MTVKELRQSLRRTSFVFPFICIHIFATIAIYAEFQLNIGSGSGIPAVLAWDPDKVGPFWWVAMTVCGIDRLPKIVAVTRNESGRPNRWFPGGRATPVWIRIACR